MRKTGTRRHSVSPSPSSDTDRRLCPLIFCSRHAIHSLCERIEHPRLYALAQSPDRHRTAPIPVGLRGQPRLQVTLVEAGQAHAALVIVGDEAIAWAEYGTPDELPNIHHSKQYLAEADVTPDYRITFIFVDKRYRKHGYAKVASSTRSDSQARLATPRSVASDLD